MKRLIVLILVSSIVGAMAMAAAASIAIPPAAMADLHMSLSAQDVAPPACAGMGLGAIISGAGVITGSEGNDLIVGSEGNDVIDGRGGNDCIIGGRGADVLIGGAGFDVCIGSSVDVTCER
ncbi:hypothetical protein [Chloroflexus sp.]|uniref:hypothetical protein n=1 Tax=Chloroflexus sp. TaxID=1904827 RepID=UPI00298ED443|nr:hypothetical protein [Chloroflexus sp.]MCX7859552.1 hypothetical protein [Chloroflexus sp.]MDW8404730.1 hypothetical protein [Chloroflexus sp.]